MGSFTLAPKNLASEEALVASGISPLLAEILSARGYSGPEEAAALLHPEALESYDPFLLEDMDLAVERIQKAIRSQEKMAVFGDYDVDGITSTSLLTQALAEMGGDVISYIPKRFGEGYGLNDQALARLKDQGISLVITVDCGISGYSQVLTGNGLGLDLIITDHHSCPAQLPPAVAVVNPRRAGSRYPFSSLAGVGVALKLVQALSPCSQWAEVLERYCDLVAVGTVADVMPLVDENRYFVAKGLKKLRVNPLLGLQLLLEATGREKEMNATTIGFTIAPRVNAAGRLDQTEVALELLLTQDISRGTELAQQLCQLNSQRQQIEGEIVASCLKELTEHPPGAVVFLWGDDWHPGVLGIVASRLAEKFRRPAFVLCLSEGQYKGSCRSFAKIDLYQVLTGCSEHLLGFGGHAQAAGFTVAKDQLPLLRQALEQQVEALPNGLISQEITVDALVQLSQLGLDAIQSLSALEPCGAGCPRPVLGVVSAKVLQASLVGEGGAHLRLRLYQNQQEVDGIYFHYSGEPLCPGQWVDVAFYPRVNSFRGVDSPQMQISYLAIGAEPGEYLLEELMERHSFPPEQASRLLPQRSIFVAVWRWLKSQEQTGSVAELAQRLYQWGELPQGQAVVCLAVFLEVELCQFEIGAGLAFPPQRDKTDLEQSSLMQHLRACART